MVSDKRQIFNLQIFIKDISVDSKKPLEIKIDENILRKLHEGEIMQVFSFF